MGVQFPTSVKLQRKGVDTPWLSKRGSAPSCSQLFGSQSPDTAQQEVPSNQLRGISTFSYNEFGKGKRLSPKNGRLWHTNFQSWHYMWQSPTWCGHAPVGPLIRGVREQSSPALALLLIESYCCCGYVLGEEWQTDKGNLLCCKVPWNGEVHEYVRVCVCLADLMSRLWVGCVKSQQASAQRGRERNGGETGMTAKKRRRPKSAEWHGRHLVWHLTDISVTRHDVIF